MREIEILRCLFSSYIWVDNPYLYTIKRINIEITNINRNIKTFYQFLIRKHILVSITGNHEVLVC